MTAEEIAQKWYDSTFGFQMKKQEFDDLVKAIKLAQEEAVKDSNKQSSYCEMVRGIGYKEGYAKGFSDAREKAAKQCYSGNGQIELAWDIVDKIKALKTK